MRTCVLIRCAPLAALAGALLFQSTTEAQQPAPKTGVVATVSATGCVERWTPEQGDAAAKAPDGVQFVLTRIEGRTASATAAGAGTPEKTPPLARYLLMSQPSLNLASHLNHQVRIDGTIAPQPTQGASLADNIANPAARETNLPDGPEPKSYRDNLVEVSTLTMIGKACGK